jgi:propionyl-CoA carboxylase alpha chain
MPGIVVGVLVETGETVGEGQPLIVMEAMKMQHTIRAPHAGTVIRIARSTGDQVGASEVLLVLEAPTGE